MPVSPTYPGVYVQEISSGVRTIAGVSTSVALFVGYTKSGPLDEPTPCFSYTDYVRAFTDDVTQSDMARQVKMFFLNGGTQAYVLRIASGTASARVDLLSEAKSPVLRLIAANPGTLGSNIRVAVTYNGNQPEDTFNLSIFRWEAQSNGTVLAKDGESFTGLSADPASPAYAVNYLNSNSKLVTAEQPPTFSSAATQGFSRSGVWFDSTALVNIAATPAAGSWNALVTASSNKIRLSVDGSAFVEVTLPANATATVGDLEAGISAAITAAYSLATLPDPLPTVQFDTVGSLSVLRITSTAASGTGSVWIRASSSADATAGLRLGTGQGGFEVGPFAADRPAPTGVTVPPTTALLDALASDTGNGTFSLNKYAVNSTTGVITASSVAVPVDFSTITSSNPLERLAALRDAINGVATNVVLVDPSAGESFPWSAELWGNRLAILPTAGPMAAGSDDNRTSGLGSTLTNIATTDCTDNVRYQCLGTAGAGTFESGGVGGNDGAAHTSATALAAYDAAYDIVRSKVDIFNLLLLPALPSDATFLEDLWPNASIFCEERRALLLMQAPDDWSATTTPLNEISTLRMGLSKQYAALYHPRITIKESGVKVNIAPVGAVAGLMARTDTARGVWKAPAGTEADLRGVAGVAEMLSDRQNGVLNPQGINCIRSFPEGIVCWGARTMDGADAFGSEYKYVPIRRLASYIEESLYRGLKWVVFEPNDEPLWAQIRLNVGAFMHNLFRQGAFQGKTPTDAYFVKCDSETTTQNDRNLGIVNIWVGFAPLKPAEFVILSLQQMAGQVAV